LFEELHMTTRRTFDEHLALFFSYATRVRALPSAAWPRIASRCAQLDDPSFRALLARAVMAARPYELWLPDGLRHKASFRALAAMSRTTQFGIAFATEVAEEFAASSDRVSAASPRVTSTRRPSTSVYFEGHRLLDEALAPLIGTHPGVTTAVRAAGEAVLRHDWLSPADFDAVYRFIEPEIPFSDL
jgi:hypothetical protein